MNEAKMKRVGVYLRVSTIDQSCELQRREITAYLEAREWLSGVQFYEDSGFTGTNSNRPQFKRLMTDARARQLDIVIVLKLDRFARSLKDLIVNMEELTQLGVSFISLKDQIDLSTSVGRLMVNLLGSFAAFEADLIKERVRAGLANAKAKGQKLGRPKVVDEAKVAELRRTGMSFAKIAAQLKLSKSIVHKTYQNITIG